MTVRSFKKKYYKEVSRQTKEELEASQRIRKYSWQTGRPLLLLGELDEMVRKFLLSLSKNVVVVNTKVANATAKALMSKHPHDVSQVDFDSVRWAKILFSRMNFVKRRKTSSKVHSWWGSKRDIVPIFPWHCIKSREIRQSICLTFKDQSNTVKVRSCG